MTKNFQIFEDLSDSKKFLHFAEVLENSCNVTDYTGFLQWDSSSWNGISKPSSLNRYAPRNSQTPKIYPTTFKG